MRVAFVVDGKPRGKARHRTDPRSGRPYVDAKAAAEEKRIAQLYRLAARSAPVMTGTVDLTIEAVFRVPVSWSKALRRAALAGDVEYTGKPDRDNIAKLYMDALNYVAWVDDAQVNRGPVIRRYGEPERVEVTIEEAKAVQGLKSPAERRREAKVASGEDLRPKRRKRASGGPIASELLAIGKRLK